jgi:peptidoglycan hydrolase-like protein with peptidoglycan-binding domain
MTARRRLTLAATGLAAVGTATAVAVLAGSSGTGSASTPRPTGATATVARRDLIQTDDQTGMLGYRDSRVAYAALGGTVTWLPAPGTVVRPDHRLFALDGRPIVLMDGSVPMYRALARGITDGADVRELERELVARGYDPHGAMTVDDHYTQATAAAVNRWKKAHGLTQNGRVELGRIAFVPGARRVATLDVHIGQRLPPQSAAPVMTTTGSRQVATVDLDASKQTEAVRGEHVDVTLPSGQVVQGVIAKVGRVAQSSSSSGSGSGGNSTGGSGTAPQATVPVTINLQRAGKLPPLDQAAVTVAFAQSIRRNVLVVPVSALLATAGGHYAVDVVGAGGAVRRTPVTPGNFAGGYVQIRGARVAPGVRVVDTAER